jgi:hypothetical protein
MQISQAEAVQMPARFFIADHTMKLFATPSDILQIENRFATTR